MHRELADTARELVDYMLFVDEAPLPVPIGKGSSGFAKVFERLGVLGIAKAGACAIWTCNGG